MSAKNFKTAETCKIFMGMKKEIKNSSQEIFLSFLKVSNYLVNI